jgi:hypothetical protein
VALSSKPSTALKIAIIITFQAFLFLTLEFVFEKQVITMKENYSLYRYIYQCGNRDTQGEAEQGKEKN